MHVRGAWKKAAEIHTQVAAQADAIEAQGRAVAALEGRVGEQARKEGGVITRHEGEIAGLQRSVVRIPPATYGVTSGPP